jgi:hypothetical protein
MEYRYCSWEAQRTYSAIYNTHTYSKFKFVLDLDRLTKDFPEHQSMEDRRYPSSRDARPVEFSRLWSTMDHVLVADQLDTQGLPFVTIRSMSVPPRDRDKDAPLLSARVKTKGFGWSWLPSLYMSYR